ncbi:MAG: CotH kinase family protein [Granulosicoccus sp.]
MKLKTPYRIILLAGTLAATLTACSDPDNSSGSDNRPNNDVPPANLLSNLVFVPAADDIVDSSAHYDQDGYSDTDVVRVDLRTVTSPGICTQENQSGCTFDDVLADTNNRDEFNVEIPVHFSGDDFPQDGSVSNATLRQRGNFSRFAPQKSFRVRLDNNEQLWRNERRLQLNKHPYDLSRIKNKLAFDLMKDIPHLPSLRTQFVNLWIDNGTGPADYGLFTHAEYVGGRYLRNRGFNSDDRLYKVQFLEFSEGDLNFLQLDAEGEPLDELQFETRLNITNGDDHTKLIEMIQAVNDSSRAFESVLDQYFNRNNVLMWVTVNLLMRNTDAVTQNFYLYNPEGTEKFYFLPWDYDGTFETESELINSFNNDELAKRKFYGYARGINSRFLTRYFRLPNIHERIVSAAQELRNTYLTNAQIAERADQLNNLTEDYLTRLPDSQHGRFEPQNSLLFTNSVESTHAALQNDFGVPMPPTLLPPAFDENGTLTLTWTPAFDVTQTNTLTYDLELSTSYLFEPENIVFSFSSIADAQGQISYELGTGGLPSGQLFVRLTARGSTDPQRYWQVASNFHRLPDGSDRFGILAITIP